MIECEKKTVYSVDTSYVVPFNKLKANHTRFSEAMRKQSMTIEIEGVGKADLKHLQKIAGEERNQAFELKMKFTSYEMTNATTSVISNTKEKYSSQLLEMIESIRKQSMTMEIEGVGKADLMHLQKIAGEERNQAFELKMKFTSYINVVLKRVVDEATLQLRSMIENFVTGEMVTEIVNTIISRGDDIDYLFQTSPSMNADREKIENNIALLLETKKHIIKVIDSIPHY
nr:hypothetical protein [Tanacetum cinerariifolium]